ncbi:MAG TPA: vanadium-dependent haloperoxidase [Burkholderiales bacterium]|nr:vanadium-dependent haloperoxidase [Burkholderiales bacterium]
MPVVEGITLVADLHDEPIDGGEIACDAFVAVFDNDATIPDPARLPFVDTPMHPEYPCAHCITAAAVAAVLESEFGTGRVSAIAMTSPTAPGVTHRWERISDYVKEVSNARVWGGIHYRNSTEVGERMGREIGRLQSVLQPAH